MSERNDVKRHDAPSEGDGGSRFKQSVRDQMTGENKSFFKRPGSTQEAWGEAGRRAATFLLALGGVAGGLGVLRAISRQ